MKANRTSSARVAILAACLWASAVHAGGTLTNFFLFQGISTDPNGRHPSGGLVHASDGNYYGTTTLQGIGNWGTVFQLTPAGQLNTIATFHNTNGNQPYGSLVQGADGRLYGTTSEGGPWKEGTVFAITTNGNLTTLAYFDGTNGAAPFDGLLPGSDGNFYGTTSAGGSGTNQSGTLFRLTPGGELTALVSFAVTNGANPFGSLVEDTNGFYYGTTYAGGLYGDGVVFRFDTNSGVVTALVSFDFTNNGANPQAGLLLASDGNFYGMTSAGGPDPSQSGTVFRMTPGGVLTTLVSFNGVNGSTPYYGALIQGSDGNLYGTTAAGGTNEVGNVFQMTLGGVVTSVGSFDALLLGGQPLGGLMEATPGSFFGTTYLSPENGNGGTIFHWTVPSPPQFLASGLSGHSYMLRFSTVTGQVYQVQYKSDINQSGWSNLGLSIPCTNSSSTVYDPMVPGSGGRVYRVVTVP
jgi:uncharacterized repeat protein (TIGR03803 family)